MRRSSRSCQRSCSCGRTARRSRCCWAWIAGRDSGATSRLPIQDEGLVSERSITVGIPGGQAMAIRGTGATGLDYDLFVEHPATETGGCNVRVEAVNAPLERSQRLVRRAAVGVVAAIGVDEQVDLAPDLGREQRREKQECEAWQTTRYAFGFGTSARAKQTERNRQEKPSKG